MLQVSNNGAPRLSTLSRSRQNAASAHNRKTCPSVSRDEVTIAQPRAHSVASGSCAACRLCAGSARKQANLPALTAIITSRPMRKPPTVAARTKALTPGAAPTCRTNCWLVGALPMRATRDAVLHHHGERRREKPHAGAGNQRCRDDPGESVFERDHE